LQERNHDASIEDALPEVAHPLHQGFVRKRGQINTAFKLRYFVLSEGKLSYYAKKPRPTDRPKGVLRCAGLEVVHHPRDSAATAAVPRIEILSAEVLLHRALRDHFQLKDDEQVDIEMFSSLVRKIMSLSHAFTAMETIESVTLEQADLLLTHAWPAAEFDSVSDAQDSDAKTLVKDLLGKGKTGEEKIKWQSPFGTNFPDPKNKRNWAFYHKTRHPTEKLDSVKQSAEREWGVKDDEELAALEGIQDADVVMQTKRLELRGLVLRLLKAGVISIPVLFWNPESEDKRERDAYRRLSGIFAAYRVETWFWELTEMLRKFMMVGFLVLISPGEPAQLGVALLITLFFLFAHLILQPFCNRQLNQMQASSQISLALTLFVGLMTIIDVYMKKEVDLAASGPWGVARENSVHELNRKIFAMIAICVNVTTFLLPVLLMLNGLTEYFPKPSDVKRKVLVMLGIVHDAPVPDETSKDGGPSASGLSWEDIGSAQPEAGTELCNDALAAALVTQATFTRTEWDKFHVLKLSVDTYIKVGDRYSSHLCGYDEVCIQSNVNTALLHDNTLCVL
jgi:hypothetical protein